MSLQALCDHALSPRIKARADSYARQGRVSIEHVARDSAVPPAFFRADNQVGYANPAGNTRVVASVFLIAA